MEPIHRAASITRRHALADRRVVLQDEILLLTRTNQDIGTRQQELDHINVYIAQIDTEIANLTPAAAPVAAPVAAGAAPLPARDPPGALTQLIYIAENYLTLLGYSCQSPSTSSPATSSTTGSVQSPSESRLHSSPRSCTHTKTSSEAFSRDVRQRRPIR